MTFEEWWADLNKDCPVIMVEEEMSELAYEAGIQEGIDRMYRLYDICPQCKVVGGQHKLDCGRGR